MCRHKLCPLLWIYHNYICSLHSFHWYRPCQYLLLNLLHFGPNLELRQSLSLYSTKSYWCIYHLSQCFHFSFLLQPFFLQCLFKFTTLSYHCLILFRSYSASINFLLITLFIPLLNSSTNSLSSHLLFLAILLNSCTNSFIVFSHYFTFFNSATFIILLSPLLDSSFKSNKSSPTVA